MIFLAALCLVAGILFLPMSRVPSAVFFLAGLGALAVALQVLEPASGPKVD